MKTSIADAIKGLAAIRDRALAGAEAGLAPLMSPIAAELRATEAHGDQTGATRAGYTAGLVGRTLDTLSPALSRSRAEVARRNPGHDLVVGVPEEVNTITVILTSTTDYQEDLSFDNAGAKDALGPTLTNNAGRLAQAAAEGIRRALG